MTIEPDRRTQERERLDRITEKTIGAAIEVHRHLGPGLLESAYEECLCRELTLRGIAFERQKPLSLNYKRTKFAKRAPCLARGPRSGPAPEARRCPSRPGSRRGLGVLSASRR